jgi:hypothetical protein
MVLTEENRRTRRKTCLTATLSTTNPTWTDLGANPGLHGGRPPTNRLSHGTATGKVTWKCCTVGWIAYYVQSCRSEIFPFFLDEPFTNNIQQCDPLQKYRVLLKVKKPSNSTPQRRLGERRYWSYSLSNSALDGVSGQRHGTAAL